MNSYSACLQHLFSLNMHGGIKLGLQNILKMMQALGNPERSFPSVHIAGTNGKGSVSTKIAKAFIAAGYKTALYTSPHLCSFRERIQINNSLIPEEDVLRLLPTLSAIAKQQEIPITFFELTTALAFCYFAEQKVDIVILETGLGGRLDATNVVHPLLSIITSISLEHTEILGNSVELIAKEKAGIIKPGVPVLVGPRVPLEVIKAAADKQKSPFFSISGHYLHFDEENSALAKAALNLLKESFSLTDSAIETGIRCRPPCRFEVFTGERLPPLVILDVAHNPDGLQHLFARITNEYPNIAFRLVLGLSKTKNIEECLKTLPEKVTHIHLIHAQNGRGLPSPELYRQAVQAGIPEEKLSVGASAAEEIQEAFHAGTKHNEAVVVCGTFFIMREARELLGIDEPRDPVDLNER